MKSLGFNAIRLPITNEMLLSTSVTSGIDFTLNPDLAGLSPLQCLDQIVAYSGQIALAVILVRYSAKANNFVNENLWYIPGDAYYTASRFLNDWVTLAAHFAGTSVIAVDLWNEPKGTVTWGTGASTDWNVIAQKVGNAVLAANSDLLIVVEGTGIDTWWGGNLKGVVHHPIQLTAPNKLVYSVHDFPSEVYPQPWFKAVNYPDNLRGRWSSFWGYLFNNGTSSSPILLGEFGSLLNNTSDKLWESNLVNYLDGQFIRNGVNSLPSNSLGISWCYRAINPDPSLITGGILKRDWTTVDSAKLLYINSDLKQSKPLLG